MPETSVPQFNPALNPIPRNMNAIRPPPPDHPYFAPMRPEPTWERLQEPSSRVRVTNTSENGQIHVVIDRFMVGHELRAGQSVEIEMIHDEIARFQEMRRTDRYYPVIDPQKPGRAKPLHPIKIEGVASMIDEAAHRQHARMMDLHGDAQNDRQDAREAREQAAAREQAMAVKGKGK